jgi:hypothetical protein
VLLATLSELSTFRLLSSTSVFHVHAGVFMISIAIQYELPRFLQFNINYLVPYQRFAIAVAAKSAKWLDPVLA